MASEQVKREDVINEGKIEIEKDRVPKMTTHFESLADKSRENQQDSHLRPSQSTGVSETQEHQQTGGAGHGPSLEEISDLRATAQHNSMEAIRAAEERYRNAEERQKEQKGVAIEAKNYAAPKNSSIEGEASKDNPLDKNQQAKDVSSAKAGSMKNTVMEKVEQAKDVFSSKGQSAAQYAAEKTEAAKGATVDASKVAGEYVGEKLTAAKDVTVESGKGAAGYAGKVASDVKDQAVVAGWGATQFTLQKVAEMTKEAAGVAGYTKDKVAGAGQTVAGYAGEKLAAAKDAVVAMEEKAADYAATKKAEAQRDLEEKKLSYEQQRSEGVESLSSEKQHEMGTPSAGYVHLQGAEEDEGEQKLERANSGDSKRAGTVLQAIGETIVEIGQTTKALLVGSEHPVQVVEGNEEPFKGNRQ